MRTEIIKKENGSYTLRILDLEEKVGFALSENEIESINSNLHNSLHKITAGISPIVEISRCYCEHIRKEWLCVKLIVGLSEFWFYPKCCIQDTLEQREKVEKYFKRYLTN